MTAGNRSYLSAAGDRSFRKIPAAGQLNSKTLAEENLKNFKGKSMGRENDIPLRVNQPQRIELPIYFNTPKRKEDIISRKRLLDKNDIMNNSVMNTSSALDMSYTDQHNRISANKRLKDYNILAFACKRAGKSRDEGRAYYSTGVLMDNLGKFKMAIEQYKRFLQVCKAIGDVHGEALAYNCIGVNYMKLGDQDSLQYKEAIEYHSKHKEIADVAGKFLAHINLGLIYNKMGDFEKASINHQFALRYAIQMSSVAGQSLAIGNLGTIGGLGTYGQMNQEKMQMFVERYLELSNELKYRKGEGGAFLHLGEIMSQKGDYDQSTKHFYRAMKISEEIGDNDGKEHAKVNFGMANASLKWDTQQNKILTDLHQAEGRAPKDESEEEEESDEDRK